MQQFVQKRKPCQKSFLPSPSFLLPFPFPGNIKNAFCISQYSYYYYFYIFQIPRKMHPFFGLQSQSIPQTTTTKAPLHIAYCILFFLSTKAYFARSSVQTLLQLHHTHIAVTKQFPRGLCSLDCTGNNNIGPNYCIPKKLSLLLTFAIKETFDFYTEGVVCWRRG